MRVLILTLAFSVLSSVDVDTLAPEPVYTCHTDTECMNQCLQHGGSINECKY